MVALLAELGYVRTVPGRGSFVLDRDEEQPTESAPDTSNAGPDK
ncbi:hypothetical protein QMZ92_31470 [Streptomyces sp. HNM0645]|nr:hypothetical protein [Streptomyces sp. HNM0645]MDI9888749.1 hypothetical protein [Streptomyces sp. HNM0645]